MEQKEINERIAMAMLRVCALVWEYSMKNPNMGAFKYSDVMKGMNTRNGKQSKPGRVKYVDSKSPDTYMKKLKAVDGVVTVTDWFDISMSFPTSDNGSTKFEFTAPVCSLFRICQDFCRKTGCSAVMNKVVFGYDTDGRWARLPNDTKRKPKKASKPKAVKAKTVAKPAEPTLGDRLRAALLKIQAKQAA